MKGDHRRRGAVAAASALAAIAIAGCGEDEPPGSPASLVPADAFVYAEASVRPEGDQLDAFEAIAARFPDGEDVGGRIVEELDESLAEDLEGEEVTWAGDIEPWLGERAAVFVNGISGSSESAEADFGVILDTTDAGAAGDALADLAAADSTEEEEKQSGGVTYFVDDDGDSSGIVDGRLVAVGSEETFLEVLAVAEGDEAALADSAGFGYEAGDVDGEEALAFATFKPGPFLDAAIAADPSAGLPKEQYEELFEASGFDPDGEVKAALELAADEAVFEYATTGAAPGLAVDAEAAELFASLPADSTVATTCPGCIESFRVGFAQGLSGSGVYGPGQLDSAIRERLGLDPEALLEALGPVALFARGTSVFDLSGAAVFAVSDVAEIRRSLDTVKRLIQRTASGEADVSGLPPGLPGAPDGFSVSPAGIPVGINVVLTDDRLVVAFGEKATLDLLEGEDTLGESGRIADAAERLGEGFEPGALIDLDSLFELITSAAASDPGVAEAEPYLEPFGEVVAGTREGDDEIVSRTIIGFD